MPVLKDMTISLNKENAIYCKCHFVMRMVGNELFFIVFIIFSLRLYNHHNNHWRLAWWGGGVKNKQIIQSP